MKNNGRELIRLNRDVPKEYEKSVERTTRANVFGSSPLADKLAHEEEMKRMDQENAREIAAQTARDRLMEKILVSSPNPEALMQNPAMGEFVRRMGLDANAISQLGAGRMATSSGSKRNLSKVGGAGGTKEFMDIFNSIHQPGTDPSKTMDKAEEVYLRMRKAIGGSEGAGTKTDRPDYRGATDERGNPISDRVVELIRADGTKFYTNRPERMGDGTQTGRSFMQGQIDTRQFDPSAEAKGLPRPSYQKPLPMAQGPTIPQVRSNRGVIMGGVGMHDPMTPLRTPASQIKRPTPLSHDPFQARHIPRRIDLRKEQKRLGIGPYSSGSLRGY